MLACSPDVIVKPPYKLSPITWVVICSGFLCLLITLLRQMRGFERVVSAFPLGVLVPPKLKSLTDSA